MAVLAAWFTMPVEGRCGNLTGTPGCREVHESFSLLLLFIICMGTKSLGSVHRLDRVMASFPYCSTNAVVQAFGRGGGVAMPFVVVASLRGSGGAVLLENEERP
jgi:hypothetical protein